MPRTLPLLALAPAVFAGPLDPPQGPITPTYKTLAEVEPRIAISTANTPGDNDATPSVFKITKPGSYYLTGNIAEAGGRSGIEIASSGVTIDLRGFTVAGDLLNSGSGITVSGAALTDITVVNGSVRDWKVAGIDLSKASAVRLAGITATGNGVAGISAGAAAAVESCSARANFGTGIAVAESSTVRGCTAANNSGDGFAVGQGGSVSWCTARGNQDGLVLQGCTTATGCAASGNAHGGITTGYGVTLQSCSAYDNAFYGIWVNDGGAALNCVASGNGTDGFTVSGGSVTNCTAVANGRDGIHLAGGQSAAVGNTCVRNGVKESGAGIRAAAEGARIDSNQVADNHYGIVAADNNLVVRNSARFNSVANYSFPAGSDYAQIITNPGNNFSSTNAWANFSY